VGHPERRLAEARKFGLTEVIHPVKHVATLRQALAAAGRGAARVAA
jgi:hypothetical protein